MAITKMEFVCLADSKKHSEHCIAGKIVGGDDHGKWFRPVSDRPSRGLSSAEASYQLGAYVKKLDWTSVDVKGVHEHEYQTENHIIADKPDWKKLGALAAAKLDEMIDTPDILWKNGLQSGNCINNQVHERDLANPLQTLYLIKIDKLEHISVDIEGAAFGNPSKKVRASFLYNGTRYKLSLTDLAAEALYKAKGEGIYHPTDITYLTISLSEVFTRATGYVKGHGYAYKVIAGVF